eukprot:maker-scaffold_1-snap-gene-2.10-mRNA-1 protein AED:0.01 eAED:0.01 QI:46/1/1/1/0/0/2/77/575
MKRNNGFKQKNPKDSGKLNTNNTQSHRAPIFPRFPAFFTDLYELTMSTAAHAHRRNEKMAHFDVYFRKAPFQGKFVVFAGLSRFLDVVETIQNDLTEADLADLHTVMRSQIPKTGSKTDPQHITNIHVNNFLQNFNEDLKRSIQKVVIKSVPEGSIVFPYVPVITIQGPYWICQFLETVCLNLVGYASLIATNAARIRRQVGKDTKLFEFGSRRAQGPDGAISAAYYSYLGGFDGTSLVCAGRQPEIKVTGTMAHAFVCSFEGCTLEDLRSQRKSCMNGIVREFEKKIKPSFQIKRNQFELAAFTSYAMIYPENFVALVDTHSVKESGIPNFLIVSLSLHELGFSGMKGIRLDSGDLLDQAQHARKVFDALKKVEKSVKDVYFSVLASNDLDEEKIAALQPNGKGPFDGFGVGTQLVTCSQQPALGMVYKLVEFDGKAVIKKSEEKGKQTLPGSKRVFRVMNRGNFVADVIAAQSEDVGKMHCVKFPLDSNPKMEKMSKDKGYEVNELMKVVKGIESVVDREELNTCAKRVRENLSKGLGSKSIFNDEVFLKTDETTHGYVYISSKVFDGVKKLE